MSYQSYVGTVSNLDSGTRAVSDINISGNQRISNITIRGSVEDSRSCKVPFNFTDTSKFGMQFVKNNVMTSIRPIGISGVSGDNVNLSVINAILSGNKYVTAMFMNGGSLTVDIYINYLLNVKRILTTPFWIGIKYQGTVVSYTSYPFGNMILCSDIKTGEYYTLTNVLYYCITNGILIPISNITYDKEALFTQVGITKEFTDLCIFGDRAILYNEELFLTLSGTGDLDNKIKTNSTGYLEYYGNTTNLKFSPNISSGTVSIKKNSIILEINKTIENGTINGKTEVDMYNYTVTNRTNIKPIVLKETSLGIYNPISPGLYMAGNSYYYSDTNSCIWVAGPYQTNPKVNILCTVEIGIPGEDFLCYYYIGVNVFTSQTIIEIINNITTYVLESLQTLIKLTTPIPIEDSWDIFHGIWNNFDYLYIQNVFKNIPNCYNLRLKGISVLLIPLSTGSGMTYNYSAVEYSSGFIEKVYPCNIIGDFSLNGIGFMISAINTISSIYEITLNSNISIVYLKPIGDISSIEKLKENISIDLYIDDMSNHNILTMINNLKFDIKIYGMQNMSELRMRSILSI